MRRFFRKMHTEHCSVNSVPTFSKDRKPYSDFPLFKELANNNRSQILRYYLDSDLFETERSDADSLKHTHTQIESQKAVDTHARRVQKAGEAP